MPWLLLDLAWGSTMLFGIVGAMLYINPMLGLAVSAIVPPLVIATWYFKQRMLDSSRMIRRENSRITAGYNEMIGGVRTTRCALDCREIPELPAAEDEATEEEAAEAEAESWPRFAARETRSGRSGGGW